MLLTALTVAPGAVAKGSTRCAQEEEPFDLTPGTFAEPPAAPVLASYAVLRRPTTAADQPPPINSLAEQLSFALGRYNPAFVRQLTQRPGGRRFFLVPGLPVHVDIPPARCLPPRLRRQRPKLVEQQRKRELEPIACVVTTSPSSKRSSSYGGNVCPRFRDVTTYEYLADGVIEGVEDAGILPDRIATVRAHFRRAPVVQVPVVENFYLYRVDPARRKQLLKRLSQAARRLERSPKPRTRAQRRRLLRRYVALNRRAIEQLTPTHIELLAADGQIVKDVRRPRGADFGFASPHSIESGGESVVTEYGEFESYCLRNPAAC